MYSLLPLHKGMSLTVETRLSRKTKRQTRKKQMLRLTKKVREMKNKDERFQGERERKDILASYADLNYLRVGKFKNDSAIKGGDTD